MSDSRRARVVLGVGGGIAAYKSCELLRLLTESGRDVRVVPTQTALSFVGAATWEALSGKPVHTDVFTDVPEVPHVRIGQDADLLLVAPATADLVAKAAHGLADDLLTNTLLTARCPVVFAPAMHTEMWEHPATQANVATLRERGAVVVEPAVGRLTGKDSGKGRLPDPEQLYAIADDLLVRGTAERRADLTGRSVVVSAGGTREYIDPVRFIGNRSSGRQGIALAEAAVARGAKVTLVAANIAVPMPAGVDVVAVESTAQLHEAMTSRSADADAVVMAAAPADFRPASSQTTKIKKAPGRSAPELELVENPDILADLVARRTASGEERARGERFDERDQRAQQAPVLVGFAAETGDDEASVIEHARAKLARKGCDLLVVNDVSAGRAFGSADNEAVILSADGGAEHVPFGPKVALAHAIWDAVAQRMDVA